MFSVEGKRIIVTGGARGIGAANVENLVRNGAHVAIIDILDKAGQKIANDASKAGPGTAIYFYADITDKAEACDVVEKAVAQLGGLDYLHNIAGVERSSPAEDITEEDFDLVFDTNVKGTLFMAQAAFKHLKVNGGGIINMGSDGALVPYVNNLHYAASKGAVHTLTRTLAHEWGKYGIRVNAVLPAAMTEMYIEHRARFSGSELQEHDAAMAKMIPLGGRIGSASEDIAPVLAFLSSDASKYITAQLLPVNGGFSSVR